ncbi:hypothetical protein BJX70DRAFT_393553 [Aspergillus crustosus]
MKLASWLLTIALVVEQVPDDADSRSPTTRQTGLPGKICHAVETTLLAHDGLVSSVHGLSICMQSIQLQLGRGDVKAAWVKLRRVIALAELIDQPNRAQNAQGNMHLDASTTEQADEIQLWMLFCAADSLLGMLLSLPSITSCHQQTTTLPLSRKGVVQTGRYLYRLTNIATKLRHLGQLSIPQSRSGTQISSVTSMLAQELHTLASQTPEAWWAGDAPGTLGVDLDYLV